tara:strand:- start:5124 stop:5723 length:600 start_codon:yes stop_codon:yes gene_type:complete
VKIDFRTIDKNYEYKQAFFASSIGSTMLMIKMCEKENGIITYTSFYNYFKKVCNKTKVRNHYNIALNFLKEKFSKIEENEIKKQWSEHFKHRVIKQSVDGYRKEAGAITLLQEKYGLKVTYAGEDKDVNFAVDLETESFAVQVKPLTYKSKTTNNKELQRTKENIKVLHKNYENKYKKPVYFIYYDAATKDFDLTEIKQ